MRKVVSIGLMIVLSLSAQSSLFAQGQDAAQQLSNVTGTARGANTQALPKAMIQIRSTKTGDLFGTTVTNETGEFFFSNVPDGDYVVEVVDESGKILGIGTPFSVAGNTAVSTSVTASASGAAGAFSSGGFSLFGMGPVTSMVVIGAASAASVTAVVSTRSNASPSR